MDVTTLAVATTAKLHLKGPAGQLLYSDAAKQRPVSVVMYGPGSSEFGDMEARQASRATKRINDNDGKLVAQTAPDRLHDTAADLASITIGFENLDYPPAGDAQGATLFHAVYADRSLGFIANQVGKFVSDWANFAQASATDKAA